MSDILRRSGAEGQRGRIHSARFSHGCRGRWPSFVHIQIVSPRSGAFEPVSAMKSINREDDKILGVWRGGEAHDYLHGGISTDIRRLGGIRAAPDATRKRPA